LAKAVFMHIIVAIAQTYVRRAQCYSLFTSIRFGREREKVISLQNYVYRTNSSAKKSKQEGTLRE